MVGEATQVDDRAVAAELADAWFAGATTNDGEAVVALFSPDGKTSSSCEQHIDRCGAG